MEKTVSGGIVFCELLTILFIGLKLTNVINWSWYLVLLPISWWIYILLFIGVIWLILAIISYIIDFVKQYME